VTMEIKSFKYAENKSFTDCIKAALPVVLDYAVPTTAKPENGAGAAVYVTALRKGLALWSPLIQAFVNSFNDELAVVQCLEGYVLDGKRKASYAPLFGYLLNALYEADCASDVAVTAWADSAEDEDEDEDDEGAGAGGKKPAVAGAGAGTASAAASAAAKARADRKELVNQKMTQKLLEALDEEEDEEDEDEEEEEEEDDE
jgi:hypothetical protein